MNAAQRKRLAEIVSELQAFASEVSEMANAEQEKFDNLSEGLQQSERGQAFETNASNLQSAESSINDAIDQIESLE